MRREHGRDQGRGDDAQSQQTHPLDFESDGVWKTTIVPRRKSTRSVVKAKNSPGRPAYCAARGGATSTMVHRSCCLLFGLVVAAIGVTLVCALFRRRQHGIWSRAGRVSGIVQRPSRCFSWRWTRMRRTRDPIILWAMSIARGRVTKPDWISMIAAALQARLRGGYAVGKALERVQGGDRLVLEQYRWQMRTNAVAANNSGQPIDMLFAGDAHGRGCVAAGSSRLLDRLV